MRKTFSVLGLIGTVSVAGSAYAHQINHDSKGRYLSMRCEGEKVYKDILVAYDGDSKIPREILGIDYKNRRVERVTFSDKDEMIVDITSILTGETVLELTCNVKKRVCLTPQQHEISLDTFLSTYEVTHEGVSKSRPGYLPRGN